MRQTCDPEAIMNEWFTVLWNQRDASVIEKYVTPKTTLHGHGDAPMCGREAFYALHRQLCEIFSQIKVTVQDCVVNENKYASRNRVDFVHAQSGKRASIHFASMVTFDEEGMVVSAWDTVDWYALLVKMDALPADALTQALSEERTFR